MKRLFLPVMLIGLCVGAISASANDSAAAADRTTPSYDMKAQSLQDLQIVQKKFVDLANTVPTDKLTWRLRQTRVRLLRSFCMSRVSDIRYLL